MSWPLVQLVAAPNVDALVLYDFNTDDLAAEVRVLGDNFSVGSPSLEGDVDALNPLYGPRTLTWRVRIDGALQDAMLAQSQLARQVVRDSGWLRFQMNEDRNPVWFRTYRMVPSDVSFERVLDVDDEAVSAWEIAFQIPAEPFAYGSGGLISTVAMTNDPTVANADGDAGCCIVLPDIEGDAPAPFRIQVSSATGNGRRWMHSLHSGLDERKPVLLDVGTGDGLSAGTDTASAASGSSYVGGSYRAVSFATNTDRVNRLSATAPPVTVSGRWKVLVRCQRAAAADGGFTLQFGQADPAGTPSLSASAVLVGEVKTFNPGTSSGAVATWVDLGDFDFPAFSPPFGEPADISNSGGWSLRVGILGTTRELRLDALLFVPVDFADTYSASTLLTGLRFDIAGRGIWDGDLEQYWQYIGGGSGVKPNRAELAGRFGRLVPGQSNVLTLLMNVDGGLSSADDKTTTYDVTIEYFPRYLWIGAG